MKIWYDVSDLVGWNLPHLTGIQRTSVGILNGLVEHGSPVGLLRYDEKSDRFCTMSESELPATVRCHLHGFAAETVASPVEAAAPAAPLPAKTVAKPARRKLKLFKKGFFFGNSGETEEMRDAIRQLKTAARQLRKSISHWAGRRLRRVGRGGGGHLAPPPNMRGMPVTVAAVPADRDPAAFISPGDALVSVGATWVSPGHAQAVAVVRRRGVIVVRMIYDMIPTIKPQVR